MSVASSSTSKRLVIDNPAYILYQGLEKRDDDDIQYTDDNILPPIINRGLAPYIILVQGPPNVGKSLLVKSLEKYFTKKEPTDVRGPITVAAGNKIRLQFLECPDDINGMIDAAKYADVVLLLIDASYGFQMETFEFLNLLRVHGFPKVFGVFTHLDACKDEIELKETKERFQNNFWTEIAEGAKLFYLSGLEEELYKMSEVQQLAEVISTIEFLPSSWRAACPYMLVDRFEDVTPQKSVRKDKKHDRDICLYGYLRGSNITHDTRFPEIYPEVHIAGVGDFLIADVTYSMERVNDFNVPWLYNDGYRAGNYIRLEVHQVPCGMVEDFDPCHPVLVGIISPEEIYGSYHSESSVSCMQARLKRHRWHMKLLNTGEQIIVSAGWRRYITTPIYAMENSKNGLLRILDYTPEHKHCVATFLGPFSLPSTRIAVIRSVPDNKDEFRIVAKGVVVEYNYAAKIVKKTTWKGIPLEISMNTAFIKFPSDVEIDRLKDAPIRTKSGTRGKVNEAVNEGAIVRCTFKHKICMRDVVLLRVWTPVDVLHLINLFTASPGSHDFIVPAETDPLKIDYHGQRWQVLQRRRVLIKEGEPFFSTSSNTLEGLYWRERRMRRMKREETHESKGEEERKKKKMLNRIKKKKVKKVFEPEPLWNENGPNELCYL